MSWLHDWSDLFLFLTANDNWESCIFSTETLSGSLFLLDDVFQSQGRAKEAFDKVEKAAAAVEAPGFGGKLAADHPSKAVNSRGSTTGY